MKNPSDNSEIIVSSDSLPGLEVKATVNKGDIVAIGVASVEQTLVDREKATLRAISENSKAVDDATLKINRMLNAYGKKCIAKDLAALNKAAKVFCDGEDIARFYSAIVEENKDNGKKCVLVSITSKLSGSLHLKGLSFPVPEDVVDAMKLHEELVSDEKKLQNDLHDIRHKMTQMPRLERTLKAAIAKKELQESGERGASLVDLIEQNTEEFLKRL